MAKFSNNQNTFLGGEMSPSFYGQTKEDLYSQGCRELKNFLSRAEGGARKRAGFRYITDEIFSGSGVKFGPFNDNTVTIPFESDTFNGTLFVTTDTSHSPLGLMLWLGNTNGTYGLPSQELRGFNASPLSYAGATGYKQFTAFTSYEDLLQIQYAQIGDVLCITHPKNPPIYIRSGDNNIKDQYTFRAGITPDRLAYGGSNTDIQALLSPSAVPATTASWVNFPYQRSTFTADCSAITGNITIDSGSTNWPAYYVGTIMRLTKTGKTGYVRIKNINGGDPTKLDAEVLKELGGTGAQEIVEEQAFGLLPNDWPAIVAFFEQRNYLFAPPSQPETFFASQIGDILEFMILRGADDPDLDSLSNDRPYSFALASNDFAGIKWAVAGKKALFIGTKNQEWIGTRSGDMSLGPLNPNFTTETGYGSHNRKAVISGNAVMFVDKSKQKIREFVFNRDEDGYRGFNLNHYASHMIKKGLKLRGSGAVYPEIRKILGQKADAEIMWVLDTNGLVHACARDRLVSQLAWSTILPGGYLSNPLNPAYVIDICLVKTADGTNEDLYALVKRTIGFSDVISWEKMEKEFIYTSLLFTPGVSGSEPLYVDSARRAIPMDESFPFFAGYTSGINGEQGFGSLVGTAHGGATVSGGALDLTAGAVQYVDYDAANNVNFMAATFSATVSFTPNWSGAPASDQHILTIAKADSNDGNLIDIYVNTSGQVVFAVKGSTTGSVALVTDYPFIAGKSLEVTVVQSSSSNRRLYINKSLVALNGAALTRDTTIALFRVGSNYNHTTTSNFKLNWFLATAGIVQSVGNSDVMFVNQKIIGLEKLEGVTVDCLVDGQYYKDKVVTGGEIDFGYAITNGGFVGIRYTARVETMALEGGSILGSAQGQIKRVEEVTINFERTVGARFGAGQRLESQEPLQDIEFRDEQYGNDEPIALFTGEKTYKFPSGYDRDKTIVVESDFPGPCNVTNIISRGLTYD